MYALVNPEELEKLKRHIPDINNLDDLKSELQVEWVNSWIFAGDNTIRSFKQFIENPNENTFAQTILSMRQELWNKKTNLPLSAFSVKSLTRE